MSIAMSARAVRFYTEYRQFYVVDPDAQYDTGADTFWTKDAFAKAMAVGDGVLGITTASYGDIRLFFEVSDRPPLLPLSPWDWVVEGSIRISRGRVAIINCTASQIQTEAAVPPGEYRLRVHCGFLSDVVEDTAGDEYFDFYWLVLWPAPFSEVIVLHEGEKPNHAVEPTRAPEGARGSP
jgi:hypothetical protein